MDVFGKKRAAEQRDRLIARKRVFGSSEGKEVLLDLMNRYHILNAHDGDPYKEGQRSVVLALLRDLHMSIKDFDNLLSGGESE